MLIQYYGDFCFKISTKPAGRATEDVVLWTDPLPKGVGLRPPQGPVDVVLRSHASDVSVENPKEPPIIFNAPGEYAVKGITLLGFLTYRDSEEGKRKGLNTVFVFESEDIRVCFLGNIGHDLTPELIDQLSGVDILFVPVGGTDGDGLDAKAAVGLIRKIEPRVIIPMHYKMVGLNTPLETEKIFCETIGNCPAERLLKLSIKKKDLEGKTIEVILLERGT